MRRVLLPLLLLVLALPAPAAAATRYVVNGAGYGHGIGMSQWGAYGYAKQGSSYRDILAHYYAGTTLGQADQRPVRVLLQDGRPTISFSGASTGGGRDLDPGRTYTVRKSGAVGVELRTSGGGSMGATDGPLVVSSASGSVRLGGTALNGVGDGAYRGALEFRPSASGGVLAVNTVGLDDYVQGVVPGESPSSWPADALRAQAVAARTYALATNRGGGVFDQYPDTRSQVYRGLSSEAASTNQATRDTAGQVLRYGNAIAVTYFFSASGGRTENVENVFYGSAPKPYLRAVESPYESASPKNHWRLSFTAAQMQSRLGGLVKGRFRSVNVLQRGASPRVVKAEVRGSGGATPVNGATLKARLGLFDTWAYFSKVSASSARSARAAQRSWTARLVPGGHTAGVVRGAIAPRPLGTARLERRAGRRWRAVRRVETSVGGRFRAPVTERGSYRLRAGTTITPVVHIR